MDRQELIIWGRQELARSIKITNFWKQNCFIPDKSGTGQISLVRDAPDKSDVDRTSPVLLVLRPKSGNSTQMKISRLGIGLNIP
jgi:hypothetical protein